MPARFPSLATYRRKHPGATLDEYALAVHGAVRNHWGQLDLPYRPDEDYVAWARRVVAIGGIPASQALMDRMNSEAGGW